MPQIKPSHLLISLIVTVALAGCGDKNSKVVFSQQSGHPSDWVLTHKTSAQADVASCAECHGDNYDGGVSQVSCTSATAVSGFACHVSSPTVNPTGCTSCHGGMPSGPFGSEAPNTKSAHTKHTALAGVDCATCHLNAGSGTANHAKAPISGRYGKATVALSPLFNADATSTATYDTASGSCSNVSCHGGMPTPAWSSSTELLVSGDNSMCLSCHKQGTGAGTPYYNSFYSGSYTASSTVNLHEFHLAQGAYCTNCHNIGTLNNFQQHFGGDFDQHVNLAGEHHGRDTGDQNWHEYNNRIRHEHKNVQHSRVSWLQRHVDSVTMPVLVHDRAVYEKQNRGGVLYVF